MGRGSGTGQRSNLHNKNSINHTTTTTNSTLYSNNPKNPNNNKRPLNSSDYDQNNETENNNNLNDIIKKSHVTSDSVVVTSSLLDSSVVGLTTSTTNIKESNSLSCDVSCLSSGLSTTTTTSIAMSIPNTYSSQPHDKYDKYDENAPLYHLITTYLGYLILIVTGHVKDFFLYRFYSNQFKNLSIQNGLAPINSGFGM